MKFHEACKQRMPLLTGGLQKDPNKLPGARAVQLVGLDDMNYDNKTLRGAEGGTS